MLSGRFRLGVGSGEALDEHILGDRWPGADERLEMPEEAVEVIRLLWEGGATRGKLVQGGVKVCWSADEAQARKTVHRLPRGEGRKPRSKPVCSRREVMSVTGRGQQ
jgi:alkanesulfonate monooxygenase SsuD/methylene tetrahydromethanopterin reductase-like flavin-dependent oxidoreductase (luciferase family)